MAKIPSFTGNNRIQPGQGGDIENPRAARRMGEAVSGFGGDVQNFGQGVERYYQERRRVDMALFEAKAEAEIVKEDLRATEFAKTNPESPKDGSQVQTDYSSLFDAVKGRIGEMKDPEKKAVAMKIATRVEKTRRNSLLAHQIERHNAFVLEESNNILNEMSFGVQNDPATLPDALERFDNMAKSMPYTGKSSESFSNAGRRALVTSALESWAAKGDYDTAKQLLNETSAGKFFSVEERKKLTDEFDKRFIKEARDKSFLEDTEYKLMKRQRQEMQERAEAEYFTRLSSAGSPTEREAILKEIDIARGQQRLTNAGYRALRVKQENVEKDLSTNLRTNYTVSYFNGKSYDSIKQQVVTDMAEGRMTHQDGMGVINSLAAKQKKEQQDPTYKRKMDAAKLVVKSRIKGSVNQWGATFYGSKELAMFADVEMEMQKLQEQGYDPVQSAKIATARIVGLEKLSGVSTIQEMETINNNVGELSKYKNSVAKKYAEMQKNGTASAEAKARVKQTLLEVNTRIEALKMKEEYENILKYSSPVKQGE